MSTAFLIVSLSMAWAAWNLYRPVYRGPRAAVASFAAGWLVGELVPWHLLVQFLVAAAFISGGALGEPAGNLALALCVASWVAMLWHLSEADLAGPVGTGALREVFGADFAERVAPDRRALWRTGVPWRASLWPFRIRRSGVERLGNIPYRELGDRTLHLDVYRRRDRPAGAPVLLQVHGGGWTIGSKDEQGLPLMNQMAAAGWVCVAVNYRLSPKATWPAHIEDVKAAIAWVREHVADYGGDPDFIVITGGSAGGHLSSLAALTANDPIWQPGFEAADTRVQGCVPFYGVYDFTDRNGDWPNKGLAELLETHVFKTTRAAAPQAFDAASPMSRVHADRPPFFVIHGDRDTLVPVAEARAFVRGLRSVGDTPALYAEIPGAQHAFEIFPSLRTQHVLDAVERFLEVIRADYERARDAERSVAA